MINRRAINLEVAVAPAESVGAEVGGTDAELLRAFISLRRESAFAELMRRHGPMVMSACRRSLGNQQDAEDAFQVTFLVLAQNAASVRRPEMLGSWLFGVARRVALKARTAGARRSAAQTRLINMLTHSPPDKDPPSEILAFLDEEIDRLPAPYRAAIVTCYLEGKTNRQAAALLGWPEGTLVTRLNRAKESLRKTASSRGIVLSSAAFSAAIAQHFGPAAAVSSELIASTAKAAAVHAVGHGVSAVVSARVAGLLHDTSHMFVLAKIKLLGLAAIALFVLSVGVAVVLTRPGARGIGGALVAPDLNVIAIPGVNDGSADVALLNSVRQTRAAAFGAARAGVGVARDDGAFDDLGSDRAVRDRQGRVRFAFSADRFLTRVDFPQEQGASLGYAGDAERILAFRALPPDPPFAQTIDQSGSPLDHKPVNFSVSQIARISPWPDDQTFFDYLLHGNRQDVEWKIKSTGPAGGSGGQGGPVVRLIVVNHAGGPYAGRISNSRMLIEFDMSHHAMTSLFQFERDGLTEQGVHSTEVQHHQITWQSAGENADVPVERRVTLASRQGQNAHIRSSSVVHFDEYALRPVSLAELSADLLGIPDGTPIRDDTNPSARPAVWRSGTAR